MNVNTWLEQATKRLAAHGISSANLDAALILAHVLDVNRTWLITHPDHDLPISTLERADELSTRRAERVPLAYLLGHREFYGRIFEVTKDTLIPRPETENLIDIAKRLSPQTIIDIGTGTGCIGITLKRELPDSHVTICDVSSAALAIAAKNSQRLNADVRLMKSDLLSNPELKSQTFDLIVANLPYVDKSWKTSPELHHEPSAALYADDGGLQLIKQLIDQAPEHLASRGFLLLEADPEQHNAIRSYAQDAFMPVQADDYVVLLQRLG